MNGSAALIREQLLAEVFNLVYVLLESLGD